MLERYNFRPQTDLSLSPDDNFTPPESSVMSAGKHWIFSFVVVCIALPIWMPKDEADREQVTMAYVIALTTFTRFIAAAISAR